MEIPWGYSPKKLSQLSKEINWVKERRLELMTDRQKFHRTLFWGSILGIVGNSLHSPTNVPLNVILGIVCAGTAYAFLLAQENHKKILSILD